MKYCISYQNKNKKYSQISKNIFLTRDDLRNKQLPKLPETSTFKYGPQALCFKGSVTWNMVPNKFKNRDRIEDFKKHINDRKPTNCSCKLCL